MEEMTTYSTHDSLESTVNVTVKLYYRHVKQSEAQKRTATDSLPLAYKVDYIILIWTKQHICYQNGNKSFADKDTISRD